MIYQAAHELITSDWFNTQAPISIEKEKGKVILIFAFQMLCPGCVSHSIPQAKKVSNLFDKDQVSVIGLHTVFEHHEVMNKQALEAFIHEYKIAFPIAIDKESDNSPLPQTMTHYQMQGTPSLIVIDKQGKLCLNHFGRLDDMFIGKVIGSLIHEGNREFSNNSSMEKRQNNNGCDENICFSESK